MEYSVTNNEVLVMSNVAIHYDWIICVFLQTQQLRPSYTPYTSTVGALQRIYAEEGIRGLYRSAR